MTGAEQTPEAAVTEMLEGTVSEGLLPLTTVTVKLCVVVPLALVAEAVTVVVPIGNTEPDAGLSVTGSDPVQSEAEAE